ncbi:uncharacterized protein LOC109719735 isoform X1 [Ananas comosus]|uniref:Uncharacterized protein LOC109719735 isoform X1 n=1 Tax=Ananas comosus TaxID=4615 RepID=A0A6P5G0I5_ANACO|nr:uncharacterized protein LOC109719735 isoform X1 [Ananas comosus]
MEVVALSTATWSLPPPPPPPQPLTSPSPPLSSLLFKSSPLKKQQPYLHISFKKERRYVLTPLRCSLGESPSTASSSSSSSSSASERWLLEPAGDGDSRHIGYRVPLPDAFEVASDTVTVGRLPENADVAIPVATVSRIHARLEKKKGNLFVTDLDSTNGTYIGYEKLKPGAATNVPPGSYITFGDIHLAMFRVSKIGVDAAAAEAGEVPAAVETLEQTS